MIEEITPEDVELEALDIHSDTGLPVEVCRQLAVHLYWQEKPYKKSAKMEALCESLGVRFETHTETLYDDMVLTYHAYLRGPKGLAYLWQE